MKENSEKRKLITGLWERTEELERMESWRKAAREYHCKKREDEPKVGLINIGEESKKGNEVSKEAHQLLSNNKRILTH